GWLVGGWASAHQFLGSRILSLLAGHERTSQTRSDRIAGDLEDQLASGVDKVAALSAVMTKASGPPITRSRRPRSDHSRSAVPSGCGRARQSVDRDPDGGDLVARGLHRRIVPVVRTVGQNLDY